MELTVKMKIFFFFSQQVISSNDASPHCGAEDNVRLLLTENSARTLVAPRGRSMVSSLNGSRGSGRQLARYRAPPSVLTPAQLFFKDDDLLCQSILNSLIKTSQNQNQKQFSHARLIISTFLLSIIHFGQSPRTCASPFCLFQGLVLSYQEKNTNVDTH